MSFVKPARPNSLSLRVLLAYVVGVILSILLMILAALVLTTWRSDAWLRADLAEYTRDLIEAVRFDPQTERPVVIIEVGGWLGTLRDGGSALRSGLLTLLCQHTSASLTIQENADPDVRILPGRGLVDRRPPGSGDLGRRR